MIVTFPHMGTMHIILRALFTGFGLKVLVPPPVSKRTLELGAAYAPETACLPFKINLGSFMQALQQGADTIVTCGGVGPCRLGYYAEVQRKILRDLGYQFDMVVIEPDIGNIWQTLRQMTPGRSWLEIYQAFRLAGVKMRALDAIERQVYLVRPLEKAEGGAESLLQSTTASVDKAANESAVGEAVEVFEAKLAALELNRSVQPLRIGVVGEIYVMLEPFINHELKRRLGEMGAQVHAPMLIGDYVRTHIFKNRQALKLSEAVLALAAPYLKHYVGGHGIKSIGHTVNMGRAGYDGILHVFPFTCMPEIVAKNILPQVSSDVDIPVLSLAFDEQTGTAGLMTRLEAFIDLLKYRRSKRVGR